VDVRGEVVERHLQVHGECESTRAHEHTIVRGVCAVLRCVLFK
jgi:hypothetical protein